MPDSTPLRYPGRELAEAIAAFHGTRPVTVAVTMIGKEDVARLLRKVRRARAMSPSRNFRCRTAAA